MLICMRARSEKAFTLLELILAVIIMAVMAGSIVVSLNGRQDPLRLRLAAEDFSKAISFAAQRARTTGLDHRVVYETASNAFWVERMDFKTGEYKVVSSMGGRSRKLYKNITIASIQRADVASADDLDFSPDGSGFSGQVTLVNQSGQKALIDVVCETSSVSIREN